MVVSHNIEFHGKDIWYNHPISKLYLTSDFSEDNWYEFFLLNTSEDDFNHKFNNIVNLKILDLKKYFIYENEILGFSIPILYRRVSNQSELTLKIKVANFLGCF